MGFVDKSSVVFLAVPDSLKNDKRFFSGVDNEKAVSFRLDPSILIPVETEPGKANFDPAKLSMETILSGMLRVISAAGEYDIPPEWITYYRSFVLTVKPEIYHEFTGASIIKAKNGEFDMALEISAILEGLFPFSPGIFLNKALILEKRALHKTGHDSAAETGEALRAYETALSMEPVLPDTLFNAGFFFMRLGKYNRAKDCFSRYISDGEDNPAEKKKQAKKIITDISSQSLDDENFIEAYDCINSGNDEEGLVKAKKFLEKRPKAWNGWFLLGWALRKLGRYEDGLESFKKAVELGGDSGDLKNETAICLMELGDYKGAQKALEQALLKEPGTPAEHTSEGFPHTNITIISNLGVLAMKTGDKSKAASYFRTVLELDPADPLAKSFLEEI